MFAVFDWDEWWLVKSVQFTRFATFSSQLAIIVFLHNNLWLTVVKFFSFITLPLSPLLSFLSQAETGLVHRLVHIDQPILKIPNICIHLARDIHNSFAPNKENHMYVHKLILCSDTLLVCQDTYCQWHYRKLHYWHYSVATPFRKRRKGSGNSSLLHLTAQYGSNHSAVLSLQLQ